MQAIAGTTMAQPWHQRWAGTGLPQRGQPGSVRLELNWHTLEKPVLGQEWIFLNGLPVMDHP